MKRSLIVIVIAVLVVSGAAFATTPTTFRGSGSRTFNLRLTYPTVVSWSAKFVNWPVGVWRISNNRTFPVAKGQLLAAGAYQLHIGGPGWTLTLTSVPATTAVAAAPQVDSNGCTPGLTLNSAGLCCNAASCTGRLGTAITAPEPAVTLTGFPLVSDFAIDVGSGGASARWNNAAGVPLSQTASVLGPNGAPVATGAFGTGGETSLYRWFMPPNHLTSGATITPGTYTITITFADAGSDVETARWKETVG